MLPRSLVLLLPTSYHIYNTIYFSIYTYNNDGGNNEKPIPLSMRPAIFIRKVFSKMFLFVWMSYDHTVFKSDCDWRLFAHHCSDDDDGDDNDNDNDSTTTTMTTHKHIVAPTYTQRPIIINNSTQTQFKYNYLCRAHSSVVHMHIHSRWWKTNAKRVTCAHTHLCT